MRRTVEAHGKINLSLRVFEKLPTGYHRIETVMIKLKLSDRISVDISDGDGVRVEMPGYPDLETDQNLTARAARAYLEKAGLKRLVSIRIEKQLPVTAGLAGGSTDAAAVFRILHESLDHPLGPDDLHALATRLGADVPFFLGDHTLGVARGIGEKIETWKGVPARPVLLVKPPFGISAKEAYQALERTLTWKDPNDISSALPGPPKNWSDLQGLFEIGNDLERAVAGRYPQIGRISDRLRELGADVAQMSGSGPTVFGLFSETKRANEAAKRMGEFGAVWVTETLDE